MANLPHQIKIQKFKGYLTDVLNLSNEISNINYGYY